MCLFFRPFFLHLKLEKCTLSLINLIQNTPYHSFVINKLKVLLRDVHMVLQPTTILSVIFTQREEGMTDIFTQT